MTRSCRIVLAIATLVAAGSACAERASEPPPRVRQERPPSTIPEAGVVGPTEPTGPESEIRFEQLPSAVAKEPSPHVEIQFPFSQQAIPIDKAATYKVRLKVEHWAVGSDGRGIVLVLDDFRPRRVATLDPAIELGALVPEDKQLSPGEHTLVALAVRENGEIVRPATPSSLAPYALVHFWVGARGTSRLSPSAPKLVHVAPYGTINGEAEAEQILLDFLVIGVELGHGKTTVVLRVRGQSARGSTILDAWQPVRLLGVPSGDFDIELELIGADGRPLSTPGARAGSTITVNRDAPVSAP